MSQSNSSYAPIEETLDELTRMGFWYRVLRVPTDRFQVILHATPESGPISWGKNFESGDTLEEAASRVLGAAMEARHGL